MPRKGVPAGQLDTGIAVGFAAVLGWGVPGFFGAGVSGVLKGCARPVDVAGAAGVERRAVLVLRERRMVLEER